MPECSYCGAGFDDEEPLLQHKADTHESELGTIDQRRVAELDGDDGGGLPTGPIVLVGVIAIAVAMVGYVIFFAGGGSAGGAGEPGAYGSTHEHGPMEMRVLGDRVDFSQSQYQVAADRFHFENGDGQIWHTHAEGVTIQWAMETLGINVTENSVTYDGATYRDSDPEYNVTVAVDGESADPSSFVLEGPSDPALAEQQGDSVLIAVERTNESA